MVSLASFTSYCCAYTVHASRQGSASSKYTGMCARTSSFGGYGVKREPSIKVYNGVRTNGTNGRTSSRSIWQVELINDEERTDGCHSGNNGAGHFCNIAYEMENALASRLILLYNELEHDPAIVVAVTPITSIMKDQVRVQY